MSAQIDSEMRPLANSIATRLIALAHEKYTFGISTIREAFALSKDGPRVVLGFRGGPRSFRAQLAHDYYRKYSQVASQQALTDCLSILEGDAQSREPTELHVRVASFKSDVWVDLGDTSGWAIRITDHDWSIEEHPPVLFHRSTTTAPLSIPTRGGDLNELWTFLNVEVQERPLIFAFLMAALNEHIPHPILAMCGEQGSGKSTLTKMLVSLLDPSVAPLRKPPSDSTSWVSAAAGSWIVALDNVSHIPPWLSDSLCRAVTGEGEVRRKLYTDSEQAVFSFRRVIILNFIDVGVMRGDLADRVLSITPVPISESTRKPEEQMLERWAEAKPRILGALLDLAVQVRNKMRAIEVTRSPRMADFGRVLAAVDSVMDTRGFERFLEQHRELAREALSADPFMCAIAAVGTEVRGSSADLLDQFAQSRPPAGWPSSPRTLTQHLHRLAPVMRKAGWQVVEDGGRNRAGIKVWTLRPPRPERERQTSDPQSPQTRNQHSQDGYAGFAGQETSPSPEGGGAEYRL